MTMDPERVEAALLAVTEDDKDAALAILKDMLVAAAGGDAAAESAGTDAGTDVTPLADEVAAGTEGQSLAHEDETSHLEEEEEEKMLSKALKKLTGKDSGAEAIALVEGLVKKVEAIDKERRVLELSARRDLIADLVKMDVETPALAWEGAAENRKPCKRLAAEPIEELRARVKILAKSRPAPIKIPKIRTESDLSELEQIALSKIKDPGQRERFLSNRADRKGN